jgi:potassium-transporting ATPase KdpC subunit
MNSHLIRPALVLLILMTCLLGIMYPLLIAGISRLAFPHQAAGSLLYQESKPIGSALIGQSFSDPKHFWGRPSATTPQPYNGLASSGSNLGPLNPALIDQVKANIKALRATDPAATAPIPVDLVTASASGLDPEISPAGALYQVARIAKARGVAPASLEKLIAAHERGKLLGLIGERRINVLELNLALDQLR